MDQIWVACFHAKRCSSLSSNRSSPTHWENLQIARKSPNPLLVIMGIQFDHRLRSPKYICIVLSLIKSMTHLYLHLFMQHQNVLLFSWWWVSYALHIYVHTCTDNLRESPPAWLHTVHCVHCPWRVQSWEGEWKEGYPLFGPDWGKGRGGYHLC